MLNQSEMDKAVLEAKKSLSDEQIKDAIRKCSYGGSPVSVDSKINSPWCGTCGAFNEMTHEIKGISFEELLLKSKRKVVR